MNLHYNILKKLKEILLNITKLNDFQTQNKSNC